MLTKGFNSMQRFNNRPRLRLESCLGVGFFLTSVFFKAQAAEKSKAEPLAVNAFCSYLGGESTQTGTPAQTLTLCDALSKALSEAPAVRGEEDLYLASEGRVDQAGLIPNPVLLGDMDKYNKEVTVQLSQTLELGGKRGDRIELAKLEQMNAKVTFSERRLEILEGVKKRFIEVLLIEQKLSFGQRRHEIALEILATARRRVAAGRGMPVETIKSQLAVTASELEVSRLQAQLANAKRQLAATLGISSTESLTALGDLTSMPVDPARFANFSVENSPALQKANLELQQRQAALSLAKSNAVPDLTLSAGARRFQEEGTTGMVFGVSVPIPILNRNQGTIRQAKGDVSASELNREAEKLRVQAELLGAIQEIQTAYAEAMAFRNMILPAAEKAFASANEIFQRGKLDYLNVLDAQRDLFNSREQYLQSLVAYHEALADLERLTGKGITELLNSGSSGK